MREAIDDWNLFCLRVMIAMGIEDMLGSSQAITDDELETLCTLRDFVCAVCSRMPAGAESVAEAETAVITAARTAAQSSYQIKTDEYKWDAPLVVGILGDWEVRHMR